MPNFILGMNAKLYTAGALFTGADEIDVTGATLTEFTNVKDLTLNLETGEADITTRANNGWRATASTLKDGSIEFELVWKPGDTEFEKFRDAWVNSTEIAVVALDQAEDVVGTQGPAGNFTVTNFSRSEGLEDALMASVTLKPSSYMQWHELSA